MNSSKFFTSLAQHRASLSAKKFTTSNEDHERGKRRWGLPKPHNRRKISAADPEWLNKWIQANGPYLIHSTSGSDTRDKILREGLIPHDQPNPADDLGMPIGSQYGGYLYPRANHVYAKAWRPTNKLFLHTVIGIDLRKLDPTRINADEDAFTHLSDQKSWGLPLREVDIDDGFSKEDEGRGAWADRVGLNDPAHVAHSLNSFGTVAVQGGVSPEALVNSDVLSKEPRDTLQIPYGGITPKEFQVGYHATGIPDDPEHVGSWKFAHKAPEPPHYKKGTATKNCGNCTMFDKGRCWGYGLKTVSKDYTCDSFEPEKKAIFSAADPNWLAEYMEKNGPYLYHGTNLDAIPEILNVGLHPHDTWGIGSRYTGWPTPRPRHVYLANHSYAASYGKKGTNLLRVDLRKLDPANLNPDEDHFDADEIPIGEKTLGDWAEKIGLGNNPMDTHFSLDRGSVAHRGYIPPHAIDEAPADAHMPWGMQRSNPNGLPNMADQWIDQSKVAATTHPLYHWTDSKNIHKWLDASEIAPAGTYLTENGEDPESSWNDDIPFMDKPVRITIDPDKLDPDQFGYDPETGEGYQNGMEWGNHYYKGIVPREAIMDVKTFKAPTHWDKEYGHGNTDTEGEARHHDIQFSNDYGMTVGAGWNFESAAKTHPNYYTGEPCWCGFDYTRFVPTHTSMVKTADKFHDFLMNPKARPDLQTPEGKEFLRTLGGRYWSEKSDGLMPWLTREWKKGRINHVNHEGSSRDNPIGLLSYQDQSDQQYGKRPISYNTLDHWADFYNSNHPEKRAMGDIMQKTLPEFMQHIQNWDEAMKNAKEQEAASHGETVHRYPDNWTLRRLTQPEELKAEGNNMGHCFVAGSLVRTKKGFIPIEDVIVGDKVIAADGKWHSVEQTFVNHYEGDLIEAYTRVGTEPLRMTGNHPVLAVHCDQEHPKVWDGSCPKRDADKHIFEWTPARELDRRQYLAANPLKDSYDLDYVTIPKHHLGKEQRTGPARQGPQGFELTPEFLWMIGLYIAEGSASENGIQFALHKDEKSYWTRLQDLFLTYGFTIQERKDKLDYNGRVMRISSRTLAEWFSEWLGRGCENKHIPAELLNLPLEKLNHLQRGILDGDNCESSQTFHQTSKMLALQMAEISLRQNGQPSISTNYPKNKKVSYAVQEPCGLTPYPRRGNNKAGFWQIGDRRAVTIYKLDQLHYSGPVYNLEVEGDHSYVVENIVVHNCVGGYGQQVQNGRSLIYSLRDPEGKPHTTMEIHPLRRREWNWPALDELAAKGNGILHPPKIITYPNMNNDAVEAGLPYDEFKEMAKLYSPDHIYENRSEPWARPHYEALESDPQFINHHYVPENGQVIQIQGKGNQEPLPEYKDRMKQWFDTFSPENKPKWADEDRFEIGDPQEIHPSYFENAIDEYGLSTPKPDVDWPAVMNNMVDDNRYRQSHHDWHWAENAYNLAKHRGEIPQFATAFGDWQDKVAQPEVDRHLDWAHDNYDGTEWMPSYPENDDDEEAMNHYDDMRSRFESEALEDHPHYEAMNNINGLLAPHYDYTTHSYQNVPEKPTFSAWNFKTEA
jgi:hypothetical protein